MSHQYNFYEGAIDSYPEAAVEMAKGCVDELAQFLKKTPEGYLIISHEALALALLKTVEVAVGKSNEVPKIDFKDGV